MFSFMRFSHLVDVIRTARKTRSIADISRAAVELASMFGYSEQAEIVAAILKATAAGDYEAVLQATSDLLLNVKELVFGKPRMGSDGTEAPSVEVSPAHAESVGRMCDSLSADLLRA